MSYTNVQIEATVKYIMQDAFNELPADKQVQIAQALAARLRAITHTRAIERRIEIDANDWTLFKDLFTWMKRTLGVKFPQDRYYVLYVDGDSSIVDAQGKVSIFYHPEKLRDPRQPAATETQKKKDVSLGCSFNEKSGLFEEVRTDFGISLTQTSSLESIIGYTVEDNDSDGGASDISDDSVSTNGSLNANSNSNNNNSDLIPIHDPRQFYHDEKRKLIKEATGEFDRHFVDQVERPRSQVLLQMYRQFLLTDQYPNTIPEVDTNASRSNISGRYKRLKQ